MLMQFDLRNYESPVFDVCHSDDDVNMILLNETTGLIAACDDSGDNMVDFNMK